MFKFDFYELIVYIKDINTNFVNSIYIKI